MIQPRHNYAPQTVEERLGYVYMPTSLFTAGARLVQRGVDVEFHDENIRPRKVTSRYVGISLVGAPYIPDVIGLQKKF